MGFGKFGAKPRAISNPLYWINLHRQDQKKVSAVDRFNERWNRLNFNYDKIHEHFISPLVDKVSQAKEKDVEKLIKLFENTNKVKADIISDIHTCRTSELSKYATCIKNLALCAIPLAAEIGIYKGIHQVEYDSKLKSILVNGEEFYFLG